jgi:hypothetical protein
MWKTENQNKWKNQQPTSQIGKIGQDNAALYIFNRSVTEVYGGQKSGSLGSWVSIVDTLPPSPF